jgi:hypothetical protein
MLPDKDIILTAHRDAQKASFGLMLVIRIGKAQRTHQGVMPN